MNRQQINHEDWLAEAKKRFGDNPLDWRFQCPRCKETQSAREFHEEKIRGVDRKVYFSCIGRWVEGRGCDWTLGGLLQIHAMEVITPKGEIIPVMEFAEVVDVAA